jgi:hypothetical protein
MRKEIKPKENIKRDFEESDNEVKKITMWLS